MRKIWNEEKIISELSISMEQIGHFPMHSELWTMGKGGLAKAISKSGGINKYREVFGVPFVMSPSGYWTDETIVNELKKVIEEIKHFPIQKEIVVLDRNDLLGGINTNGGLTKFRELMKYKVDKLPNGYWSEEKCIVELQKIIDNIKHFPSQLDLILLDRTDLTNAIRKNGGFVKFRDKIGYHLDRSSSSVYNIKRGKNTENILFEILSDYCKQKDIELPMKNVGLAHKNVIEFVCNTNKRIGIDVTTTHSTTVVSRKWTKKDYYKYLDELWIVVVSDSFKQHQYDKWNKESPDNVYVYSIEEFCKELQYDLDDDMKTKIDKYKSCTFHTRNNHQ